MPHAFNKSKKASGWSKLQRIGRAKMGKARRMATTKGPTTFQKRIWTNTARKSVASNF